MLRNQSWGEEREAKSVLQWWQIAVDMGFTSLKLGDWFSYVGKIPDNRGFYFFSDHPRFCRYIGSICTRGLSQIFPIMNYLFVIGGTGAQQFRGLVMSEIHHRRIPMSRTVQIWVSICRIWSPTIAEISDTSGKKERSRFSRCVTVHPRRSEISKISSFH